MTSYYFPAVIPHLQPKHGWNIPTHLHIAVRLQGRVWQVHETLKRKQLHLSRQVQWSQLPWMERTSRGKQIFGGKTQLDHHGNFWCLFGFLFKFYLFVFSCNVSSLCTGFLWLRQAGGWVTPQLSWAVFSLCWFLWLLSRPPEWQTQ